MAAAVAFLVNGGLDSPMGQRARAFADRLGGVRAVEITYRSGGRREGITRMRSALARQRPGLVYVFDLAVAGVTAALAHRVRTGTPFVVDTGDAITALARQGGSPGRIAATALLEATGLRTAAHLVVRGTSHRDLLAARGYEATVIPDGVDTSVFKPADRASARGCLGWDEQLVVAVIGSCVWSPRFQMAYGWDLVEALASLRDCAIRGVLVGEGSGLAHLRARADALGVLDRIRFMGWQPLESLPALLAACDVCLSTQSADVVGEVRTTGKLPLYMACGKYVLASAVGEARRVLPSEMLVPYEGVRDEAYPARLAERLRILHGTPERLAAGLANVAVAQRTFDYDVLARRLDGVIDRVAAAAA